jgi:hypothetical protein
VNFDGRLLVAGPIGRGCERLSLGASDPDGEGAEPPGRSDGGTDAFPDPATVAARGTDRNHGLALVKPQDGRYFSPSPLGKRTRQEGRPRATDTSGKGRQGELGPRDKETT